MLHFFQPTLVAHICNPSSSGSRDKRIKMLARPYFLNNPVLVVHAYNPSYMGCKGSKIMVHSCPGEKPETLPKINSSKK
jgi:hypothetical protein